jgi:hypothetical protein
MPNHIKRSGLNAGLPFVKIGMHLSACRTAGHFPKKEELTYLLGILRRHSIQIRKKGSSPVRLLPGKVMYLFLLNQLHLRPADASRNCRNFRHYRRSVRKIHHRRNTRLSVF